MTKTCSKCHRDLPLTEYPKHPQCRDGVRPDCKECVHKRRVEIYARNRERNQAYSREYYAENKEKCQQTTAAYHRKNKAKITAYQKQWRSENREKLLADKKAHYNANKEWYAARFRAYDKLHPEYNKASTIRRRARAKAAAGDCSAVQWRDKCRYWGFRCYLCHADLTNQTIHIDHRTPLSRGGSNWPANLAPACGPCNLSKNHKTEREYRNR